ncbi:hypothetical protein [Helicobacter turcicus]|uniref:Uncharacterized protein n=1 Tax=Helicobacter turcicus TaxID=2867412 RepID=A0ABS7JPI0_9HELI|nr:hypothetical protein [Helicobacter turcicus]MBX7491273.1 hypothetical protein [Helicobacter turcicus]MBX7546088.1 hypothetical protein [Helicobacter turcicus]
MQTIQDLKLENKELQETIKKLRNDNFYLKNIQNFFMETSNMKYGGVADIATAFERIHEYKLEVDCAAGEYLASLANEFEDSSQIDLVALVESKMAEEVSDEINALLEEAEIYKEIDFEVDGNFLDTSSYLSKESQEILREALQKDNTLLDSISLEAKNFLEKAQFNLEQEKEKALKQSDSATYHSECSEESQSQTHTRKNRR